MKHIILSVLLVVFAISNSLSQNYIYKGDSQFESTNSWEFKLNSTYWTGNPEFTVAKTNTGTGYLMIAINVPFKSHYISGTVILFLENGKTIKCTDKGVRDHVDNQCLAIYNFTKEEIKLLKNNKIARIRFSIIGGMEGKKAYTADNKKPFFNNFSHKDETEYYETDLEIMKLFTE
jgi:hypothetical protein